MQQDFDFYIKLMFVPKGGAMAHAFGPGTADLLRGVQSHQSLNKAAKEMGMAYSKAWKAIKSTEEQLGFSLMDRKRPGGSVVTEEGAAILSMFDEMASAARMAVIEVYERSKGALAK